MSIVYLAAIWYDNSRRDAIMNTSSDAGTDDEGISEDKTEILGDMALDFRYQY